MCIRDRANVVNDIQFPTTRDLKIDGKYTPVVITSSDPGVIEAPTTPNSARVWVYRPLPGESAKTVTLTVKILDRPNGPQPGDNLSAMRVLASKEIKVTVQPLTQAEIDAEVALMELVKVKVNYWNGIRNANTDQNNVTTDLHAFQECYLDTDGSQMCIRDRCSPSPEIALRRRAALAAASQGRWPVSLAMTNVHAPFQLDLRL